MALETLIASQQAAAEILGVDYGLVTEMQEVETHHLGAIELAGREPFPATRVHTGPSDLIAKGGIRMHDYGSPKAARAGATELSAEMLPKLWVRGYTDYRGGKGVMLIDPNKLSPAEKHEAAVQYAGLMIAEGLAKHLISVPAGDMGTNGLSNAYVETVRDTEGDPYWQATATGKTPELGGLAFRTKATGYGVFVTQRTLMEERNLDRATAAVQGFGNVGSWYAYFATNDPQRRITITAISEREGTLYTNDPAGFTITKEMVEALGDNPLHRGPKLAKLKAWIEQNQPGLKVEFKGDPNYIITGHAVDYFVPAAGPDVVNASNVADLAARRGVIEAANGPVTAEASRQLADRKAVDAQGNFVEQFEDVPDFVANGAGVDCSIIEHQNNIAAVEAAQASSESGEEPKEYKPPEDADVQAALEWSSSTLLRSTLEAAKEMRTSDIRVAASGLYIARNMPGVLDVELQAA